MDRESCLANFILDGHDYPKEVIRLHIPTLSRPPDVDIPALLEPICAPHKTHLELALQ